MKILLTIVLCLFLVGSVFAIPERRFVPQPEVAAETLHPNPFDFIVIKGWNIRVNDSLISVGDSLKMYVNSPNGEIFCGEALVRRFDSYYNAIRYTVIYGDDSYTPEQDGMLRGDTIIFKWEHAGVTKRIYPEVPLVFTVNFFDSTVVYDMNVFHTSCCNIKGDINNNGIVDVEDFTELFKHLFMTYEPLQCEAAADVDNDGTVDIYDFTELYKYLFTTFEPLEPCK